ncbi:MAG: class I SAM-dependent methyltransferase, partial [Phormidium sp.]
MNIEQDLKKDYQKKASNYFELERHEMLKYVPEKACNILDVGCGCGNFGRLLKEKRPVKVWGVEFNEDAATLAAQKLDQVICGSFNSSLNLPKNEFDCIIFNDVLEHLVDPFTALIYAKYLLREGGLVVASIPNIRHFDTIWDLLVNKNWQYTDSGILDRTHLRFFTQRSIV